MFDRKTRREALLQELAASFVQKEANTDPMITVTRTDMSPDFKKALIFFTTIPDGREPEALIFLKRSATEFRNFLKKEARMKRIPHIEFMVDAGERHRQHMDEIVREIESDTK